MIASSKGAKVIDTAAVLRVLCGYKLVNGLWTKPPSRTQGVPVLRSPDRDHD